MSKYDYEVSIRLMREEVPFDALIMAAIRKADSLNAQKLKDAWPEVWDELSQRYEAPGGILPQRGEWHNDQRRTAHPAARPSEIEGAARELMTAIFDVDHDHCHWDHVLRSPEFADEAARRLARALGMVEEE